MRFWGRGLREGFSIPVLSAADEPALSDLRGFTNLADRLDDYELTAVLNVYFDRLVGAVMHHGEEVLKFIGDGMLAVFPFKRFDSPFFTSGQAWHAPGAQAIVRAKTQKKKGETSRV